YDGFPQVEDGIGITRFFLEALDQYLRRARPGVLDREQGIVACGTLIGPTMAGAVERFNAHTGAELAVRPIDNNYISTEINVSGLLTGTDLIEQLKDIPGDGPVFVTKKMVSDRNGLLLDDSRLEDVASALRRPVVPCESMSDVARYMRRNRRAVPKVA